MRASNYYFLVTLRLFAQPSGKTISGTDLVVALRLGIFSAMASDSLTNNLYECLSLSNVDQFSQSILCLVRAT